MTANRYSIHLQKEKAFMTANLKRKFCSSYCSTVAVRLVIRGEKLFFLKRSQPLRGNCLVGVLSEGDGKRIVLEPDADGGYDLSTLDHTDQVITLCRHIPDTNNYSSYIRVPMAMRRSTYTSSIVPSTQTSTCTRFPRKF